MGSEGSRVCVDLRPLTMRPETATLALCPTYKTSLQSSNLPGTLTPATVCSRSVTTQDHSASTSRSACELVTALIGPDLAQIV